MIKMKSLTAEGGGSKRIEIDGLILTLLPDKQATGYHNIYVTDPAAEWQSVWSVWADPDMPLVSNIRINVTGLAKEPLKMWYAYYHPRDGRKESSSKIQDKDWGRLRGRTKGKKPREGKIWFDRASWIDNGEKKEANYLIYLSCKGGWDYRIKK